MKAGLFDDWPADYRERFWQAYPRRVAKLAALKALDKARARGDVPWAKLIGAIARYTTWLKEPGWRPEPKHPATWLNNGCWDDELESGDRRSSNGFAAIARQLMDDEREGNDGERNGTPDGSRAISGRNIH